MCEGVAVIVCDILRKVILIPVIIVLTLFEWCGTFLAGILSTVVSFVAGLLLLVTIASYLLGLFTGMETLRNTGILLVAVVGCNLLVCMVGIIKAVRTLIIDHL